jgi:hypothetical protein
MKLDSVRLVPRVAREGFAVRRNLKKGGTNTTSIGEKGNPQLYLRDKRTFGVLPPKNQVTAAWSIQLHLV